MAVVCSCTYIILGIVPQTFCQQLMLALLLILAAMALEATMLETKVFLRDGSVQNLALKCSPAPSTSSSSRRSPGRELHWELRRLLPAVGFVEKSEKTKTCKVWSQNLSTSFGTDL